MRVSPHKGLVLPTIHLELIIRKTVYFKTKLCKSMQEIAQQAAEVTCSAPTVLIGLHLYKLLIKRGINELCKSTNDGQFGQGNCYIRKQMRLTGWKNNSFCTFQTSQLRLQHR